MDENPLIENEGCAECPHCHWSQTGISAFSKEDEVYKCEHCGEKFILESIDEETIYYFSTRKYIPQLTEEEKQELQNKEDNKPIPGQIDIFGGVVGDEL